MPRPRGSKNKPKPVVAEAAPDQIVIRISGDLQIRLQAIAMLTHRAVSELVLDSLNEMLEKFPDKKTLEDLVSFAKHVAGQGQKI